MLIAFLTTRAGKLAAGAVLFVVALLALALWLRSERQEAVEADRAKAVAEATQRARRADEAAQATTQAIQNETERTNEQARDAAANDPDPLGAGFRELRRSSEARGGSAPGKSR